MAGVNVTRREMLKWSAAMAAAGTVRAAETSRRPPIGKRKFTSKAVEQTISTVKAKIADTELAWMFENCYPNTLDTTVNFRMVEGKPDTFVITGDIDAMWLRDSSAQVWPYLPLAKEDPELRRMIEGVIRRQTACILIDPYANAFMPGQHDPPLSWAVHDKTDMHPGVGERKWEIDSLCYTVRLAHGYWKATGDTSPFDARWRTAAQTIVKTFREQQRKDGPGPYSFQRESTSPTESQFLGGYGNPTRPVGLIHSMFRPSDDACLYPLFVPANLFAVTALRYLAELFGSALSDNATAAECITLSQEIRQALGQYAVIKNATHGEIWAYEVDGYGNQLFMDDANAPSLLSLPYLDCCAIDDPLYLRTRAAVWSKANPYFFEGKAGQGIGGPREGLGMIWPMSILMRALTTADEGEILACLRSIKETHAGTGFIHESFQQDNPKHFTRPWFAWANTLFGELIVKLSQDRPDLLRRKLS
jgi:uncharacterized protein